MLAGGCGELTWLATARTFVSSISSSSWSAIAIGASQSWGLSRLQDQKVGQKLEYMRRWNNQNTRSRRTLQERTNSGRAILAWWKVCFNVETRTWWRGCDMHDLPHPDEAEHPLKVSQRGCMSAEIPDYFRMPSSLTHEGLTRSGFRIWTIVFMNLMLGRLSISNICIKTSLMSSVRR